MQRKLKKKVKLKKKDENENEELLVKKRTMNLIKKLTGQTKNIVRMSNNNSLLVIGRTGSGKTHLITNIVQNQYKRHFVILVDPLLQVFDHPLKSRADMLITPSNDDNGDWVDGLIAQAQGLQPLPTIIVIDGLYFSNNTMFERILQKICQAGIKMILTSQGPSYWITKLQNWNVIVFPTLGEQTLQVYQLSLTLLPPRTLYFIKNFTDIENVDQHLVDVQNLKLKYPFLYLKQKCDGTYEVLYKRDTSNFRTFLLGSHKKNRKGIVQSLPLDILELISYNYFLQM